MTNDCTTRCRPTSLWAQNAAKTGATVLLVGAA